MPFEQLVTLLSGAVFGKGLQLWILRHSKHKQDCLVTIIIVLVVVYAAFISGVNMESNITFQYHNHKRWSGIWGNPNIYGLLMGTGVILLLGLCANICLTRSEVFNQESRVFGQRIFKLNIFALCLLLVGFMGNNLLHSFSRGAWLATLCGFTYLSILTWKCRHELHIIICRTLKTNSTVFKKKYNLLYFRIIFLITRCYASLTIIAFSISLVVFWQIQETDSDLVRRTISVCNQNDFSWRNRVTSWETTLQMMADRPYFGFGWHTTEIVYNRFYCPAKLQEPTTIRLNSYFILGSMIGLPALFLLFANIGLNFIIAETMSSQLVKCRSLVDLHSVCRAGVVVLLTGFLFDGGLFILPTSFVFWGLFELSNILE
jgi:hypothetical protein